MPASGVVSDAPAEDLLTTLQRIGKDFPIADNLSFHRGIERFRHSIISAGTDRAHGLGHS
ncbi:hypothetical protein CSTAT_00340 [Corynebacterium stationis]|nr:hypothetical protein CSTAT_00340 [Corynebacterium stationis]